MRSDAITRPSLRQLGAGALVTATVVGALLGVAPTATAGGIPNPAAAQTDPASADRSDGAYITRIENITDRWVRVFVYSPAMQSEQEVQVLLPRDTSASRPTLYMLDGRSAAPGTSNWTTQGNAVEFFEDKPVNVVLTTGGRASYFTDWDQPDPALGNYKWETFLTEELPPLIDDRFDGNGIQSIAGLSMGAQSAMMLAMRSPGLYRGVAAYSGCYETTGDLGQTQMRLVVSSYGGDITNMWGPFTDPKWAEHDVVINAEKLRGTTMYVSTATGLPGPNENLGNPDLIPLVTQGGPIEAVTNFCTHQLDDRLRSLGIPATFVYNPVGVHTWAYWRDELPKSWPTLAASLGV
ncbi:alpha/beta hydrolase [Rhodococcus sp. TAF43]|uniref:alpha/beta hydrolase n=1 Tax=unclassified Rhodococcus (in: high G+C Gram-positive bacteria) TaxID=192944 RepID=UPI001583C7E0|nr:alpha/beta hydrolase family protein [Rhodococcus sp. W8901]QKT13027.1 esterase family protein [Rhodococcus sp. W8901]